MDEETFWIERPDLEGEPGVEPMPKDLRWYSMALMLLAPSAGVSLYRMGAPFWVALAGCLVTLLTIVGEIWRTRRGFARRDRSEVIDDLEHAYRRSY